MGPLCSVFDTPCESTIVLKEKVKEKKVLEIEDSKVGNRDQSGRFDSCPLDKLTLYTYAH